MTTTRTDLPTAITTAIAAELDAVRTAALADAIAAVTALLAEARTDTDAPDGYADGCDDALTVLSRLA